jgi:pimeloyl-ACP methyl ester carboxylesterase
MRRLPVLGVAVATLAAGTILAATPAQAASAAASAAPAPTVVLVHGAWEQPSSWTVVAAQLREHGYPVVVPDNPLRTLSGDAASIAGVLKGVAGPIVLVGHSYGGSVITSAADGNPNVKALVYIAAFAPERGESALGLDLRVPGSLLPVAIVPAPFVQPGGSLGLDVTVNPLLFRAAFAQDVPPPAAAAMAAAQRPVTLAALMEQSATPTWRTIPSWYLVARNDRAIPPATQRFMAARARAGTVEIDSSHAAQVAHPDAVTNLILAAGEAAGAAGAPSTPAMAPAIAGLRLLPSTFRAARSGPAVAAASVRTAARVSYTLNAPASVRLTVQRAARGRKAGGRCLPRAAGDRGGPDCTLFAAVRGSFTRVRPAGADRFTFTGRIAGRALAPGRYRLVATPSAGGRTGRPARARLRIVR